MKILIDADGCPVVDEAIAVARKTNVPVLLVCDTAHSFQRPGAQTVQVDKGADSADLALAARCAKGDVVITQDYGVAAMALALGAHCLNQDGSAYTEQNIGGLLESRHTARKIRRGGGRLKGPAKRRPEQDQAFAAALAKLLDQLQK